MKDLSKKELDRRKLIQKAINDYFGGQINERVYSRILKAIVSRNFNGLESDEILHARHIADNVKDESYMEALLCG